MTFFPILIVFLACTIVLRGASSHILEEADRSLHDALCVLVDTVKNHKVIYGGGHSEIAMASAVEKAAKTIKGKQALAMEAYARALRQLPIIIADNGGIKKIRIKINIINTYK